MADVIIPVLDEVAALPGILSVLPPGYRAIVVDNGSSDGSGDVARSYGAVVVEEPVRGFGSACWAGLVAADPEDGIVCFMDGDGSLDAADLEAVAGPVRERRAELVLGARRPTGQGAWPLHLRLTNATLARELRRRTGARLTDVGPMRAARRDDLLALGMRDRRFGWPLEMILRAGAAGWRLLEVPVPYRERSGGHSKVTGTLSGTARTVWDMGRLLR